VAELLRLPEVATGTTEAVLSSWSVTESSKITARDVIATVETAKAVVDVEAESDGVVLRLLVNPGEDVATGDPIAVIGSPDESVSDVDALLRELGVAAGDAPEPAPAAEEPVALEVPEAATTQEPSPIDAVEVPPPTAQDGGAGRRTFASQLARTWRRRAQRHLPRRRRPLRPRRVPWPPRPARARPGTPTCRTPGSAG
jgi:pyruvate dehydrogenase E2 component (dihydrolipoamide acetyltransferase)